MTTDIHMSQSSLQQATHEEGKEMRWYIMRKDLTKIEESPMSGLVNRSWVNDYLAKAIVDKRKNVQTSTSVSHWHEEAGYGLNL